MTPLACLVQDWYDAAFHELVTPMPKDTPTVVKPKQSIADEFFRYWNLRFQAGSVSGLERSEVAMVRVFANWVESTYDLTPKDTDEDNHD